MAEMLTRPELAALQPSPFPEPASDALIGKSLRTFDTQSRQQAVDAVQRARRRGDIVKSPDAETLGAMVTGALLYRRPLIGEATDASAVCTMVRQADQGSPIPEVNKEDS